MSHIIVVSVILTVKYLAGCLLSSWHS